MTYNVVLAVERNISPEDADQVVEMLADIEDVHVHVVVPEHVTAHSIEAVIEDYAMDRGLVDRHAVDRHQRDPVEVAHEDAEKILAQVVEALGAKGVDVDGEVTERNLLVRLGELTAEHGIDELVVLARPHVVTEALRVDLASRARRRLGVPVLRLYAHKG